jgi:hypothetical protein
MIEVAIDSQNVIDTVLDSRDFAEALNEALVEHDFSLNVLVGDIVDSIKDDDKLDGITNEMFDLLEVIRDANRRLELLERPLWKKIYDWLKRIG